MNLEEKIKQMAIEIGFDAIGITTAEPICQTSQNHMSNWLNENKHAKMEYLNRNFDKRFNPALLLNNAKSVICCAVSYSPKNNTSLFSNYAIYDDYHTTLKNMLFNLAEFIQKITSTHIKFKACVDSVPIAEREFANRAGIGFIAKNHMLINENMGCEFFLAELITTLELKADSPDERKCLDCGRCIQLCPTKALTQDGSFDSNLCLSYHTIESKDDIPEEIAKKMDKVYGCDICGSICPHQKYAQIKANSNLLENKELQKLTLNEIATMSPSEFDKIFKNSPVKRTGYTKVTNTAKIMLKK